MSTPSTTWVWHVDLDQFIAAVEVLRRPELAGLPIVVGGRGDPTERGVVATASYAARAFGVGSGMPLRIAARKCPDAIFLPVDHRAYDEASEHVMATLRSLEFEGCPVYVQVLGWDEAFVALAPQVSGSTVIEDPIIFARQIRDEVLAATGLSCSVGIGDNKLRAKMATDFGKPDRDPPPANPGVGLLTEGEWFPLLGDQPVTAIWGIGKQTAKRLAQLDIHTVRQLADSDARVLAAEIGPTMGPWFHRLGRGVDTSTVDPEPWVPRAHGREETYQQDLEDWDDVRRAIRALTERVLADINAEGRPAARVIIKVRFKPFLTFSRSRKLPTPTNDLETLADVAEMLLERLDSRRPVRLLGVRLEMVEPD